MSIDTGLGYCSLIFASEKLVLIFCRMYSVAFTWEQFHLKYLLT